MKKAVLILLFFASAQCIAQDLRAVADSAIAITERNIYNPELLNSESWQEFKAEMRSTEIKDIKDLREKWSNASSKLPFTHYYLFKTPTATPAAPATGNTADSRNKSFDLKQLDEGITLLTIKDFSAYKEDMLPVIDSLKQWSPRYLIIDLRKNPGGTIAPAVPLVQYLIDRTMYGGVLLGRNYFLTHQELPTVAEYKNLRSFSEASYEEIIKAIHESDGLCLVFEPEKVTFRGMVYVLTDRGTASTCEPLVYGLKTNGYATIVGERTAGAMMSAEPFNVAGGFTLFMPTADYFTADGKHLDRVGVEPDIEVPSDKALEKTLEIIRTPK